MTDPFWSDEQDLSDREQERLDPNTEFETEHPDGAGASIAAAAALDYQPPLSGMIDRRAEALQTISNDPDKPDLFEDDVYLSQRRAEHAVAAVMHRGFGAAQDSRGVDSPVRWAAARADEFGALVKEGQPDDSEYRQDNDLLPFGHPRRTIEDPPEGLSETPFVEGVPESERKRERLRDLARRRR